MADDSPTPNPPESARSAPTAPATDESLECPVCGTWPDQSIRAPSASGLGAMVKRSAAMPRENMAALRLTMAPEKSAGTRH